MSLHVVWSWRDWHIGRLPGGGGLSMVYRWGFYLGPLFVGRWMEWPA